MKNNPIYEVFIAYKNCEIDYNDPVVSISIEDEHLVVDNGYGIWHYAWADILHWEIRQK